MIKKYLNILRETKAWFYLLRLIIVPFYDFLWIYVINFQGRILKLFFTLKTKNKNNNFFLKKNDKKIIKNVPEFKKIIDEINLHLNENFLKEMRKKISEKKYIEGHYLFNGKNFYIDMFPYIEESLKKKIVDFALNDFNISIVNDYLKVMPIIGKISLNLNIPLHDAKEGGSMLWHKDDFGYKSLDLFLPLNYVNENNGPLCYVEKKNNLGVFHKIKKIKKNALLGERNKIELNTFEEISNGNYKVFLSQIGDGLFIDSFACYHKGGYCKKNERLMLRISYQTPDSIDVVEKHNDNGFRYYSNYKENDFKFFDYKKYLLFKRLKFLKVHYNLINFYRLFHYKSNDLF